jgi:hypothetical protein
MLFLFFTDAESQEIKNMQLNESADFLSQKLQKLPLDEVHRIEITRIPSEFYSIVALPPEALDHGWYKLTIYDLSVIRGDLKKALQATVVKETSEHSDLRWALFFFNKNGERLMSVYFNDGGRKGYINSTPVLFDSGLFSSMGLFKWMKNIPHSIF